MAPRRKRGVNKAIPKEELRLGDLVLAKVKGFPAWPAKIGQPQDWDYAPDPKKHFVQFFGTQEIAFVTPPDIQAFTSEAKNKLLERCQGKTVKYFAQAVEEISAAFEELQNHKSGISGNEALLNAVEPSLTKPKVLDQTAHREAGNDKFFDKFESGADPFLGELVENNGVETKPDIVEKDSSLFLKSNNRTTSASREPLEHESPDLIIKVSGFDDKINGVISTEHRDGSGKNNSQRIIKKLTGDLDRRCIEVHRTKCVPDSGAATDNHLHGPNQKLKDSGKECFDSELVSDVNITSSKKRKKLLRDNPSAQVFDYKHKYALGCKSGTLGKTKRFQSEPKKSASGADESKRASKRTWSKDANGQQRRKSKSLLPVGEGKAEGSDSIGVVSIPKREIVLGISAQRGKIDSDKEWVAYAKRRKQTVEHTSVPSFSGSRDKEGTNHSKRKISSASDIDVTVSTAQLLKRRRAVYISDEDNDKDPETSMHGGHTNVSKANLDAIDGPKSANVSRDTSTDTYKAKLLAEHAESAQLPKRRKTVCIYDEIDDDNPKTPVHGKHTDVPKAILASTDGPINASSSHDTSFDTFVKALLAGSAESVQKRKVPLCKHNKDVSHALPDSMEEYISPMGKPVKELLPKYVKLSLRSPKNSPQLVSFTKQVTGKNKNADVSGVRMANSVEGPSNSSSMGKPVIKVPAKHVKQILRSPKKPPLLFSSKEQVAGQNRFAKVSGAGIPKKCKGNSSDRVSSSPSLTANQKIQPALGEKPTGRPKVATRLNDAGVPRDISVNLATGIGDVNQENGSASGIPGSLSMKDLTTAAQAKRKQARSHTPSSACIAMLIVAQGHQEDLTVSNHGHQSSLNNQTEPEEKEGRSVGSGNWSVGGSLSGDTEAAISRDAFEGMLETLSRTKESIGRATRQAIVCAKYGIATEVVEVLIRKLEIEPHFPRKVDLFFLVDSITQRSHNQKGKAGALYILTVQAALPRLLSAAAPPGTGARENRHQCRKVLKLWLERRIFPDSLLRRYIGDISGSGGDSTVGFSLRRPSRSERAIDDPIRDMEGMLIDEYGSNASFQLPGFLSSHTFGYDKEDEDLPRTSPEVTNTRMEEPVHALGKLKAHDSSSKNSLGVLEDVNDVLEMEVVSCQLRDEVLTYACGIEAKEDSLAATTASSPPQLPLSSPSEQCSSPLPAPWAPLAPLQSIARPLSSITQASMPSNTSFLLQPGFDPPACEYQKPMLQDHSSISTSKQIDQVLENAAHGRHADGDFICNNRFLSATTGKTTPRNNELSTCC